MSPTKMMQKTVVLALVFSIGAVFGAEAKKKKKESIDAALYQGVPAEEAAANLLDRAGDLTGKGSWQNIALAKMYHLWGKHDEAQSILDGIRDKDGDEWVRIGRMYYQAGDWDQAKAAFDRVLQSDPEDADWLAEIGMYHNLQGDRETAEELFARSFREDADDLYNVLKAAGSYVGVEER